MRAWFPPHVLVIFDVRRLWTISREDQGILHRAQGAKRSKQAHSTDCRVAG